MRVVVHEVTGRELEFRLPHSATPRELLELVQDEIGAPEEAIRIRIPNGPVLQAGGDCSLFEATLLHSQTMRRAHRGMQEDEDRQWLRQQLQLDMQEKQQHLDLELLYTDMDGGCCLQRYKCRIYWCCICEFDMGNGCVECGICWNRIASRCMDDGCEVECICEQCSCKCCTDTCVIL